MSEYEKLDSNWIEDNEFLVNDESGVDYTVVESRKLKGVLVPKQEREQKYYVLNNEKYFLLGKDKGHGFIFSTGGNSKLGSMERTSATFELTEQEIKDYDERYFAFAVKAEELEE